MDLGQGRHPHRLQLSDHGVEDASIDNLLTFRDSNVSEAVDDCARKLGQLPDEHQPDSANGERATPLASDTGQHLASIAISHDALDFPDVIEHTGQNDTLSSSNSPAGPLDVDLPRDVFVEDQLTTEAQIEELGTLRIQIKLPTDFLTDSATPVAIQSDRSKIDPLAGSQTFSNRLRITGIDGAAVLPVNGNQVLRASTAHRSVTTQDWESNKSLIKSLYMDLNFKLRDVMEIMEAVHNFRAT